MSFWMHSNRFPPILVRLLARHQHGAPLSETEIAEASGLQPWQVSALSMNTTWAGVDLPTMQKFLKGCRMDFCDSAQMKRAYAYSRYQVKLGRMNRTTFRHLRRSKAWFSLYHPMYVRYLTSLNEPRTIQGGTG